MPMIKVLLRGERQAELARRYDVVATYPAFAVVSADAGQAEELAASALVEDISDQYAIPVGGELTTTLDTSLPRVTTTRTEAHPDYGDVPSPGPGPHHYLVQFVGPVKAEWTAAVEAAGGVVVDGHAGFAVVVRADEATVRRIADQPAVRWVGHLPPRARNNTPAEVGAAGAEVLPRTQHLPGTLVVEFFTPQDAAVARAEVEALGLRVVADDAQAGVLVVEQPDDGDGAQRDALAGVHGVRSVRRRALNRTSNDVAAGLIGADVAALGADGDLDGAGEVVGICDTGFDTGTTDPAHPDFAGRVRSVRSYPISPDFAQYVRNPGADDGPADVDSGHGTHVAGSAVGDGAESRTLGMDPPVRGLAHRAELVFQAVEQALDWRDPQYLRRYGRYLLAGIPADLTTLFADAYADGVRVHSNSWGGGDPGAYDSQCRQLDQFVRDHPQMCVLVAAGNDGTDRDRDGEIDTGSVTAPGTAKNCITVGASESVRPAFNGEAYGEWWPQDYPVAPYATAPMADDPDDVVAFSSRGPTTDGRIKPDVVAPGTWILSTKSTMLSPTATGWRPFPPSKSYFYMGGTSMATPLTAGAVAVVRQYLRRELGIAEPTAALLKAALVAGAARIATVGPKGAVVDPQQGFGRVDVAAVVNAGDGVRLVAHQDGALETGGSSAVEVAVTESAVPLRVVLAYADFPGAALVNDLNLVVTGPDGTHRLGNQPEGAVPPAFDTHNNVEVVHVAQPAPGRWTVEVVGANVPRGPQPFALVVRTAT